MISNPVNSTVPICAEIFKSKGTYNPKRLFGVTTLDVVRASRFISQHKGTDPADENITVVGGHSGATIVPLLSQSGYSLEGKDLDDFVFRVQFGGDEVVKAKDGAGSATLSMAMAGARFAESLLKAAQGQKGVVEPTFVDSPLYKDQGIDFFASKVELGPNGVERIHEVGKITPKEQELLDAALKDLKKNIVKGTSFVPPFNSPLRKHTTTDFGMQVLSSSSQTRRQGCSFCPVRTISAHALTLRVGFKPPLIGPILRPFNDWLDFLWPKKLRGYICVNSPRQMSALPSCQTSRANPFPR